MSKKTLMIAAAALAASTAFAVPAMAKPDTPVRGAVMFWLLDRNSDGAIDQAEVEELRATIFDAVDVDGDGRVTKEEFVAVLETFHAGPGERGKGKGARGYDDDRRGHGQRGERGGHGPRHSKMEERGERRGDQRKDFAEHRGERMMERLGIDSSEGLSKSDFVTGKAILFERTDKDGNGTVSKSEFDQVRGNIGRLIIME